VEKSRELGPGAAEGKRSRCRVVSQCILFDHDAKFGNAALEFLQSSGLKPVRTSIRSFAATVTALNALSSFG
jgi:hypothetical protein